MSSPQLPSERESLRSSAGHKCPPPPSSSRTFPAPSSRPTAPPTRRPAAARDLPARVSGGMRRRVAMAQKWMIAGESLLMDEPFSALDIHTRHLMEAELLALWEESERKTVVFVTHDLEEAIALADDV